MNKKSITRLLLSTTMVICFSLLTTAQLSYNLGVDVRFHTTSSLIGKGFLSPEELDNIFSAKKYYISPELGLEFDARFRRHTAGIRSSLVFYQRPLVLAIPLSLSYDFSLFKTANTPFVRGEIGYSFFLTDGLVYGFGAGYKLGKFVLSLNYQNQFRKYAVLEKGEYALSRISSISVGVRFNFLNNRPLCKSRNAIVDSTKSIH